MIIDTSAQIRNSDSSAGMAEGYQENKGRSKPGSGPSTFQHPFLDRSNRSQNLASVHSNRGGGHSQTRRTQRPTFSLKGSKQFIKDMYGSESEDEGEEYVEAPNETPPKNPTVTTQLGRKQEKVVNEKIATNNSKTSTVPTVATTEAGKSTSTVPQSGIDNTKVISDTTRNIVDEESGAKPKMVKKKRLTAIERQQQYQEMRNLKLKEDTARLERDKDDKMTEILSNLERAEKEAYANPNININEDTKVSDMTIHDLVTLCNSLHIYNNDMLAEAAAVSNLAMDKIIEIDQTIDEQESKNRQTDSKYNRLEKIEEDTKKRIKETEDAKDSIVIQLRDNINKPINRKDPKEIMGAVIQHLSRIPGFKKDGRNKAIVTVAPEDVKNAFILIPQTTNVRYKADGWANLPTGVKFISVSKKEAVMDVWRNLGEQDKLLHPLKQFVPKYKMRDDKNFNYHRIQAAVKNIKGENAPFVRSSNPVSFFVVQETGTRYVNRKCSHRRISCPKIGDPAYRWTAWHKKMVTAKEQILRHLKPQILKQMDIPEYAQATLDNLEAPASGVSPDYQ